MKGLKQRFWVGLVALAVGACADDNPLSGGPSEPAGPGTCEQDFDCGEGLEYRRGTCRPARCQSDADCCPGQICSVAVGLCADQNIACTTDADCAENPGQTCIDFRGGQFCGYPNLGNTLTDAQTQRCDGPEDCAAGRACVGQRCVVFAPCDGGCPDGQVCDVDTNVCFEEPSCNLTCGVGEILVVADPDLMSGPQCCAVDCACAVLPPVEVGQLGWYTDLAVDAQQLVASGYDPVYGDLVVGYYTATGTRTALDYVDGFPDAGPVVGNPAGPRGGRIAAGPNVGEHTSVAIDATGAIHVAYYDRDQGRLKYAVGADGAWSVSVVDESEHVGLYTSLALTPDGRPQIAYMMAEGTVDADPTPRSGLKLAIGTTTRPAAPSDWMVELIDHRPLPPPPCGGPCEAGALCTDLDIGIDPACLPVVDIARCDNCNAAESCVEVATNDFACAEAFEEAPNDDLIPGVGLFASLAITSAGGSVIAYYDRIDTLLKLARSTADGFDIRVLDGADPIVPVGPGPDAGQHASVAVNADDQIGVAYFDATNDDLVYFDVGRNRRIVVDDGVSPPDQRFVGADADLMFDADGQPTIAYQDPTFIDLLYARRIEGVWSTEVIRGDAGALSTGFYASQALRGSTAFIGGVDVNFDADGNLRLDLAVVPKSLAP